MTCRPSSFAIDVPDALLARMRQGERAAFEQVYRWFERPVFTLALRICGEREQAADVLQDTMLKVIGRIGEFRAVELRKARAARSGAASTAIRCTRRAR